MTQKSTNKCLIVDDQTEFLFMLQMMLSGKGYKVFTAESVDEGMVLFLSKNPDIVITDWIMPNKGGDKFVAEIREHNAWIPIIIMSGYDLSQINQDIFSQPSVKYWLKSANFTELFSLIIHMLVT